MMKKRIMIALVALLAIVATAGAQEQQAEKQQLNKVYDEQINPLEQIDQAVAQAAAQGKFVICQVGGNWCPWCLRFADFITNDSTISQMIADNFVYIHVNYRPNTKDEAKKALGQQVLKRLGNPARFGFPVFVVLDGKGNVIHIQDSVFLEEGKGYNKDRTIRFFKSWTPAAVNQ